MKFKNCNTFLSQIVGLMFHPKTIPYRFVFKNPEKVTVHTWFVFYPIKVSFYNEKNSLVDEKIMKPFTIYKTDKKVKYFIEKHF